MWVASDVGVGVSDVGMGGQWCWCGWSVMLVQVVGDVGVGGQWFGVGSQRYWSVVSDVDVGVWKVSDIGVGGQSC